MSCLSPSSPACKMSSCLRSPLPLPPCLNLQILMIQVQTVKHNSYSEFNLLFSFSQKNH